MIDAQSFAGKLVKKDKVILDYGRIELTVTGFEDKEVYKKAQ